MKKLKKSSVVLAATLGLSSCVIVHAGSIEVEETRNLTLATDGVSEFKIDATSGFLIIKGEDGLDSIKVQAEVFAEDKDYTLALEKSGDRAVLVADPDTTNWGSWGGISESPKINLTITMPSRLLLKVKDGSGSIRIDNIKNNVEIDDGSGELSLKDVTGNVSIEDGSGPLELKNITGSLDIVDGSGSLEVEDVSGRVTIDDGSGAINVKNIGGELKLEDGSGGIRVVNVGGHVTISDGSGGIKLDTLRQGVTILESGSGDLVMDNVEGKISTR